jgi:type I restriction enzyme, S subunit
MTSPVYKSLSDCARSLSGGTPSKSNDSFWAGDLPWVSSGEMGQPRITDTELHITHQAGEKYSKIVPARKILVVVRGMSLAKEFRVSITQREMAFNQDLKALIAKEDVNSLFLFYSLYGKRFEICKLASESAHGTKKLDTEVLNSIPVFLPSILTQKKIAAIACAYDDLIENNDRRITLLEKMAEEIYREWFVRLRFPGHEQVASHKGIPEDWESKRFDEFCLLQRGFDLPDDKVKPGIYPVVASTSIKTYHSEPKVNPPVITTGRSGSLGTVLFVNSSAWPLNTTLFVKNFFGNSPYLIYYTLKFLKLENFNAGAGVPSLNRNHLGGLHMSVPPKILQNRFDENISIIFKQKENLANANEKLKQTRDRLLTRLISGKLSVEDLDIQFPPSMTEALEANNDR